MRNKILKFSNLAAALSFLFGASQALACTSISLSQSNVNLNSNPSPTLEVTVSRALIITSCEYFVSFSKGTANDGSYNRYIQRSSAKISHQLYNDAGTSILVDYPDASPPSSQLLTGSFAFLSGSNDQSKTYKAILGRVPYSSTPGAYTNSFQAKLYTRALNSNGAWVLRDSDTFTHTYTLNPALDLSLVTPGAPFNMLDTSETLDFGTLENNEVKSVDMIIGNNVPFRFRVSTNFAGYMRKSGSSSTSLQENLAFRLEIGSNSLFSGAQVNVSGYPYTSPSFSPPTGSETRFPLNVRIVDNPAAKKQGVYTAVLTIDIEAI